VRVAVPAPPLTIALPRSFLVFTETRVFPAMMSLRTLLMPVLVRSLTLRVPISGMMWRSIRPVSVTIVEAFFGLPPFSQDETGLQISEIAGTELLHGDRPVIELAPSAGSSPPATRPSCTFASRRAVSGAQAP
jgi:hypothetical protein